MINKTHVKASSVSTILARLGGRLRAFYDTAIGSHLHKLPVEERTKMASDAHTSHDDLEALAHDPDAAVRQFVARNVATPSAVLKHFASDPMPSVRMAAKSNRNYYR